MAIEVEFFGVGGWFCPVLFPNKNAPIATTTITITITATIRSVGSAEVCCCYFKIEGAELGEVLDVGVDDAVVGEE